MTRLRSPRLRRPPAPTSATPATGTVGLAGAPPPTCRPVRHRDPRRPGVGRRTARAARPAGRGAPLSGRRGPLRRAPRDGRLGGRRPRPADPGLAAGRPGGRRGRRARVAELIGPELGWDARARRGRGRGLRRGSGATDWPGPDSTPTPPPGGRSPAASARVDRRAGGRPGDPTHPGDGRSTPTPVGGDRPSRRTAGGRGRRPGRAAGRRLCRRLRAGPATAAEAGRDWWPLAIGWAAAGEVPARPALVARPTDTAQVAAVLAACDAGPGAGHRRPAGGAACAGPRSRSSGAWPSTCAVWPASVDVDDRLAGRRPPRRHLRPRRGGRTARRPRRHARALAPVHGPLHRRRLAGLPGGRAVLEPLREDRGHGASASRWCWPTAGWSAPAGTGPGRPPARTSPSCSSGARAPSASSPRAASGSTRCPRARAGGRSASTRSPRVSTPAGGSCGGARPRPSSASTTTTESGRSFDRPDTNVLIVLDEADPGLVEATLAVVDAGVRVDAAVLDDGAGRPLARATATTCRPWPRCGAAGVVVDTVEVAARWSALPGLYRSWSTPSRACRAPWSPRSHQSHAYTDGACLYFTFAGRPPEALHADDADAGADAAWDRATTTGRPGTGSPRPPRTPGGPSATTTASASTGPASCPPRSVRLRRAGLGQGGARPPGHPQPGQARPPRRPSATGGRGQ